MTEPDEPAAGAVLQPRTDDVLGDIRHGFDVLAAGQQKIIERLTALIDRQREQ